MKIVKPIKRITPEVHEALIKAGFKYIYSKPTSDYDAVYADSEHYELEIAKYKGIAICHSMDQNMVKFIARIKKGTFIEAEYPYDNFIIHLDGFMNKCNLK